WHTVISARSGETEDVTIVHLAVGWCADQIKVGSFSRSERMAKWNEAIRVEQTLGSRARFAGRVAIGGARTLVAAQRRDAAEPIPIEKQRRRKKNRRRGMPVKNQIQFLSLVAKELPDPFLGIHLAEGIELREIAFTRCPLYP